MTLAALFGIFVWWQSCENCFKVKDSSVRLTAKPTRRYVVSKVSVYAQEETLSGWADDSHQKAPNSAWFTTNWWTPGKTEGLSTKKGWNVCLQTHMSLKTGTTDMVHHSTLWIPIWHVWFNRRRSDFHWRQLLTGSAWSQSWLVALHGRGGWSVRRPPCWPCSVPHSWLCRRP